jgi:CSLREA domain-containing protein
VIGILEDRLAPAIIAVTTFADIVNPADNVVSLREAINLANVTPGPDTILLKAGVYKIGLAGADDANAAGDFDVTGSTLFQGAGAASTIIDGQRLDRVFDVRGTAPSSIKVTFQGLTIRNGLAGNGDGGGIRVGNADLLVQDCSITDNQATGFGGGISNAALGDTGNVKLVRSNVVRNVAGLGGGIFVVASVANPRSFLTVSDSTILHNQATGGGGIYATEMIMTGSTLSGNTTTLDGGGFFGNFATLTGCTLSGNSAVFNGGGMIAGAATLTDSSISGNSAVAEGGGIHTSGLTLLNVTVAGNRAHTGGGVFVRSGGITSVRNTLIAKNLIGQGGVGPDVFGAFTSGGHNLIGEGTGSTGFINATNGDQVGTAAHRIDPRLAPLANNGGPTPTLALLAGSPAIDHGDNTGAPATDQRGVARPRDGDGNGSRIVDIGAFER